MTALTQWNPFQTVETMQNRLSSFSGWAPVRNGYSAPVNQDWAPAVDVIENDNEFIIRADLPGVSKNDLAVTLEDGELILKATRQAEPLAEGAQYLFNDRPFGTFTRTFIVPAWADASCIRAEFNHGVLTVKLEKAEHAKPRTIPVQSE